MDQIEQVGIAVANVCERGFDVAGDHNSDPLTGKQGVMIPASNVKHLMLRADVVEACKEKKFRILPITTIAEGIEVLTGKKSGKRGAGGKYPSGSVNRLVEDRLIEFAALRAKAAARAREE